MRPWIIDAKDIEATADVRDFKEQLFHTTNLTERYLAVDNTSELIVVAPKGCGKTLLLKAKRIAVGHDGITCLPADALVDKPIGTPRIYSRQDIASITNSEEYWQTIWLITLILAVLKYRGAAKDLEFESAALQRIAQGENYRSSCDIFAMLIAMNRSEYFPATEDLRSVLIPEFRRLHTPIYIFIDNVDEFFEAHLGMDSKHDPVSGVLEKAFWYFAQLGLVAAAREIHSVNSHIKVCASLRKEVVQIMMDTELGLQLHGAMLDITYDVEDLEDILIRNIRAESSENLVSPRSENAFERFVGEEASKLQHPATAEVEKIRDYMIRHTLWRPRDLAVLGKSISTTPVVRRTEHNVKECITRSTIQVARSYISECKPHLTGFDENILLPLVANNVLDIEMISEISKKYDERYAASQNTEAVDRHIFCQLYKIGLLGYLKEVDHTGALIQTFLLPGEGPPENAGILPESTHYLVHPVLDALIASLNSEYFLNMDKLNIVGRNRLWRDESDFSFVLKGDVVGYSQIMGDPELATRFPKFFQLLVDEAKKALEYGAVDGGDGVLLIDKNPMNLIKAAQKICSALQQEPYKKQLRFGGSNGIVTVDREKELSGGSIRTAARIERYALPGTILVDGEFLGRLEGDARELFEAASVESHSQIPRVDGRYDVRKGKSDVPTLVDLYVFDCSGATNN